MLNRTIAVLGLCTLFGLVGCGTTRMTDTSRSATEQLLLSQAIDNAVNRLDFTPMAGKQVFFEEKCLDGSVDKGYVASSIRQHLLAAGCLLAEEKAKATYVVEARSGCVGTDKQSFLVGVPQMQLPAIMPGTPPAIPEMPLIKSTAQQGIAKIAVFAYNRQTGRAVWQSGIQEFTSSSKDAFVLGMGPFHRGTLRRNETPINQIDVLGVMDKDQETEQTQGQPHITQAMAWQEPAGSPKPTIVPVGNVTPPTNK